MAVQVPLSSCLRLRLGVTSPRPPRPPPRVPPASRAPNLADFGMIKGNTHQTTFCTNPHCCVVCCVLCVVCCVLCCVVLCCVVLCCVVLCCVVCVVLCCVVLCAIDSPPNWLTIDSFALLSFGYCAFSVAGSLTPAPACNHPLGLGAANF